MEGYLLFWFHLAVSCMMVGLIWFVQMVHYPLFLLVGEKEHGEYHVAHMSRTAIVVAPMMLAELGSGLLLLLSLGDFGRPIWFIVSLGALGLIWLSTFFVQVRYHRKLDFGRDLVAMKRLVMTNWFRTLLWSIRPVLLVAAIR
ncbi:MAG: hypothetical protein AAF558_01105 [Verrucomicrobiota bacterium]